jgi:hypothetical protein
MRRDPLFWERVFMAAVVVAAAVLLVMLADVLAAKLPWN